MKNNKFNTPSQSSYETLTPPDTYNNLNNPAPTELEPPHEQTSAERNQEYASDTARDARRSQSTRHSRREVHNSLLDKESNPEIHAVAMSRAQKIGHAIGRFARRTYNALRQGSQAASEAWNQTKPTAVPAYDSQPKFVHNNQAFADRQRTTLVDMVNQQHDAQQRTQESATTATIVPVEKAPWRGGFFVGEDGNKYYKPADKEPTSSTEEISGFHTETSEAESYFEMKTHEALADENGSMYFALPPEKQPTRNYNSEPHTEATTEDLGVDEDSSEQPQNTSVSQEGPAEIPQPHTESPRTSDKKSSSVDPGEIQRRAKELQEARDSVAVLPSSTTRENFEAAAASFDPTKQYSYEEIMEMVPDDNTTRVAWENSILQLHGGENAIEQSPSGDMLGKVILLKNIYSQVESTRRAQQEGRLSGPRKGSVSGAAGRANLGARWVQREAFRNGLVPSDTGMGSDSPVGTKNMQEIGKELGIDVSHIPGYNEAFGW